MDNYFKFSGEVVRFKDFETNGGNVTVRGVASDDFGDSPCEVSIFMYGDTWYKFQSRPFKYKNICFEGHFKIRVHFTDTGNKKENLKMIADKFSPIVTKRFVRVKQTQSCS